MKAMGKKTLQGERYGKHGTTLVLGEKALKEERLKTVTERIQPPASP